MASLKKINEVGPRGIKFQPARMSGGLQISK